MYIPLSWLKSHIELKCDIKHLEMTLNKVGLEVEEISKYSPEEVKGVVVGQVLNIEKHPNADRLNLCKVSDGIEEYDVVCGAKNLEVDMKIAFAKAGTRIQGRKLKKSKIRGIKSEGMICSAEELSLVDNNPDGIIKLPESYTVGKCLADEMQMEDTIIKVAITPNRGDCLGVRGIARDLFAAEVGDLKKVEENKNNQATFEANTKVSICEECDLFCGYYIKNLSNNQSPGWLKDRLVKSGITPKSAIVDICNYVMLDYGQPLHAYDISKLENKDFSVCLLDKGEEFYALDGNKYIIPRGSVVVKIGCITQCVAGIIGSMESACTSDTNEIFLEAAHFNSVNLSENKLGIQTDARYRFERNISSAFTRDSLEYAKDLIISICGGVSSELVYEDNREKEKKSEIVLDKNFIARVLGNDISQQLVENILMKLGFGIRITDSIMSVVTPPWRTDISNKYDVCEEIFRIYGYDAVKTNALECIYLPYEEDFKTNIRRALSFRGMTEVITWSFTNSLVSDGIKINNPISDELDVMRTTMIPNMLDVMRSDEARDIDDNSIFEIGSIFSSLDNYETVITGIRGKINKKKSMYFQSRGNDIFDSKGDIFAIFQSLRIEEKDTQIIEKNGKFVVSKNDKIIAELETIKQYFSFVFYFDRAKEFFNTKKEKITSDYQRVVRDFSFVINKNTRVGDILNTIESLDKLITHVNLFDVFKLDEINISIALSVTIQSDNKTLSDKEITSVVDNITETVISRYNATLRDGKSLSK